MIDTVLVGNPGNPADPLNSRLVPGIGSVGYEYRIGKYEVTNAQYAFFLNQVAAADPLGLYSPSMASDARGGIIRSGSSGSYTYIVKPGYADMPVVWVSFWDAARFVNWLGTGYTEGRVNSFSPLLPGAAYDTQFAVTPAFAAGDRLPGAAVFLPSENEWYKAAYHHPQSAGGPNDNYWLYATRGDTRPASRPPMLAANSANYYHDDFIPNGINEGYAVTQTPGFVDGQNYLTDVGAYGPGSESFYGTADQNGNVWEWNDTNRGLWRRLARGGSWNSAFFDLWSEEWVEHDSSDERGDLGFRVASQAPIPEPGVYGALVGALALSLVRRKC